MSIRRLLPNDASEYRALALAGYAEAQDAFTATVEERAHLPVSWWAERLAPAPDAESVVYGAFHEGRLVGMAGLRFEQRPKTRHKATLFGMYVAPQARQHGFGQALVEACLAHARAHAGTLVVQLTVTEGNTRAESLYARCGFVRFGVEPLAISDGVTFWGKVHMWCAVQATRRD